MTPALKWHIRAAAETVRDNPSAENMRAYHDALTQITPADAVALLDDSSAMLEALQSALHAVDADKLPETAEKIRAAITVANGCAA